jgi:hypothetical protein
MDAFVERCAGLDVYMARVLLAPPMPPVPFAVSPSTRTRLHMVSIGRIPTAGGLVAPRLDAP